MPAEHHFPHIEVLVNGALVEDRLIREVVVRDNLATPDTAAVTLTDAHYGPEIDQYDVGVELEVKFSRISSQSATSVFKGFITALEPEWGPDGMRLTLRAYDGTFKMKQQPKSRTFQDAKVGDVASKLFGDHGISASVQSGNDPVRPFLQQSNETDWDFLQRLARMQNLELLSSGGKVEMKPLDRDRGQPVVLVWGGASNPDEGTLVNFAPRATTAQQHSEVEVRFWDVKQAKAATAKAQAGPAPAKTKLDAAKLRGFVPKSKLTVVDRPASSADEAKARATGLMQRAADAAIEATGVAFGDPRLKAGAKVEITKVGRFEGTYTLSGTTHVYRRGKYRTKFQISGRQTRDLFEMLSNGNGGGGRHWAGGLVVGVVTNNNDPDKLHRVRVRFPALSDSDEGWWARIASLHAGDKRGMFFLPEVNDEVVVGFEHGDVTRPYVLGSVFNGKAKIGEYGNPDAKSRDTFKQDGSLHIQTPKKFVVTTDDNIWMKTKADHHLVSEKGSKQTVGKELEVTVGGGWVQKTGKTITIESGQMQKIVIKAGGDLTLQAAPLSKVSIEGGQVTVKGQNTLELSSKSVSIKGMSINLG